MSSLWSPLYIQHTIAAMAQTVLKEIVNDWKHELTIMKTSVFGNTERINATDARVEGMREDLDALHDKERSVDDELEELDQTTSAHDRRIRALENDMYMLQCRADAAEKGLKSALEGLAVSRQIIEELQRAAR